MDAYNSSSCTGGNKGENNDFSVFSLLLSTIEQQLQNKTEVVLHGLKYWLK